MYLMVFNIDRLIIKIICFKLCIINYIHLHTSVDWLYIVVRPFDNFPFHRVVIAYCWMTAKLRHWLWPYLLFILPYMLRLSDMQGILETTPSNWVVIHIRKLTIFQFIISILNLMYFNGQRRFQFVQVKGHSSRNFDPNLAQGILSQRRYLKFV